MIRFERVLPGELDGTLDPRDYGFEVVKCDISEEEALLGAAQLYRSARARTGEEIPKLDHLLELQPYDPEPARALLRRCENLKYPYNCEFGGAQLEIDKGVFPPTLTNASPFLLSSVDFNPGEKMLDAFAGSGAFGINAALNFNSVVAIDISPEAIACIEKNARINGVAELVEARLGSIAACRALGERFDLITANPPLVPLPPEEGLQTAIFDHELKATKQFIASLPELLASRGRCYLLTSDVIDRKEYKCDISELCVQAGLRMLTIAKLHKEYESYRVHKIEHKRSTRLRNILSSSPLKRF